MTLKPCPCGKVPTELFYVKAPNLALWMLVWGGCCEWRVYGNRSVILTDEDEMVRIWNAAPRGKE